MIMVAIDLDIDNEEETEIKNLEKLTDTKIEEIVNHIPKELLTTKHKEYIIIYLKTRKKILINSIGGTKNESNFNTEI